MPQYSIVVPLSGEEEDITELYCRLKVVMEATGESFELVFVDDGGDYDTFGMLQEIASVDRRVVVVKLSRDFGQGSALAAGFDHAEGEYVIVMDGDLQHNPHDIPVFLRKLRVGYDIVSGRRRQRTGDFVLGSVSSKIANWLMARLSGVELHDFGATFQAYRREVVQALPLYGEVHRFIPALASAYGASVCEVSIRSVDRECDESRSGIAHAFRMLFGFIVTRFLLQYMSRPLHLLGGLGVAAMVSGGGLGFWMAIQRILNPNWDVMHEHGPLLIFAAVLVLAGVQLLVLGLIEEMHARYHHDQNRAPYSVERVLRAEERERPTHSE